MLRPLGQWNFYHIWVIGHTIKVELNGEVILNGDVSTVHEFMDNHKHPGLMRTTGGFGFTGHDDPVAFRNIKIKRLETATRPATAPAESVTAESESKGDSPQRERRNTLARGVSQSGRSRALPGGRGWRGPAFRIAKPANAACFTRPA